MFYRFDLQSPQQPSFTNNKYAEIENNSIPNARLYISIGKSSDYLFPTNFTFFLSDFLSGDSFA